jgi:hypothetical protein
VKFILATFLIGLVAVSFYLSLVSPISALGVSDVEVRISPHGISIKVREVSNNALWNLESVVLAPVDNESPPLRLPADEIGAFDWKSLRDPYIVSASDIPLKEIVIGKAYTLELMFSLVEGNLSLRRRYISVRTVSFAHGSRESVAIIDLTPPRTESLLPVPDLSSTLDPHLYVLSWESRARVATSREDYPLLRIFPSLINPEFHGEAFRDLQSLTNDELAFHEDGISIRIIDRAVPPYTKPYGTALVRTLIENPVGWTKCVNVTYDNQYNAAFALVLNGANASTAEGSDVNVRYDPFNDELPLPTITEAGIRMSLPSPSNINLTHELLHALHSISGEFIDEVTTMYVSIWIGTSEQIALAELYGEEEKRTVGLDRYWPPNHPTQFEKTGEWAGSLPLAYGFDSLLSENAIRIEQGEPLRVDY